MRAKLQGMLVDAYKGGDSVKKALLQTILGEISNKEVIRGKTFTEDEIQKLMRGIREGNRQTLSLLNGKDHPSKNKLESENSILDSLIIEPISVDKICNECQSILPQLQSVNNKQAIGIAMKHLKTQGYIVLGDDVKAAIDIIRP